MFPGTRKCENAMLTVVQGKEAASRCIRIPSLAVAATAILSIPACVLAACVQSVKCTYLQNMCTKDLYSIVTQCVGIYFWGPLDKVLCWDLMLQWVLL